MYYIADAPRYLGTTVMGTPFNDTRAEINIEDYTANPTNVLNVTWKHNGTVNVTNNTLPNILILERVQLEDNGDYTVHTCNSVGCGDGAVTIDVYCELVVIMFHTYLSLVDGPTFSGLVTNGSQWLEIETGHQLSIACVVQASHPPVTSMSFTYKHSGNEITRKGTDSITLEITKANQSNTQNYTCEAVNSATKSYSVFQTFVGGMYVKVNICQYMLIGRPDKVKIVKVEPIFKGSGSNTTVTVKLEVTDASLAPARNITYNIKV